METIHKPVNTNQNGIHYEKATCPTCGAEVCIRYQSLPQLQILGLVDKHGVTTNSHSNPGFEAIYNLWNEQHIIIHRNMTRDMVKAIRASLKEYSESEIMQAINNYAEILKGKQYWFNYTWTLADFLKRGLPKFLDLAIAKRNYLQHEIKRRGKLLPKVCRRCGYKDRTSDIRCPQCGEALAKDYLGKYEHLIHQ